MSKATIQIEGFLANDGRTGQTNNGDQYLNLSVAHTPRRKNRETGQWEDAGETLWVQFTLWREEAEAFAPHAVKGTLVRVEGEPTIRFYDKNGQAAVNVDVKFARASVIPRQQSQGRAGSPGTASGGDGATAPAGGAQNDAWSTPGSYGDDTPF